MVENWSVECEAVFWRYRYWHAFLIIYSLIHLTDLLTPPPFHPSLFPSDRFTHSPTRSLPPPASRTLTHSLAQSLTFSSSHSSPLTHSLTHSGRFTRPPTLPSSRPPSTSLTHSHFLPHSLPQPHSLTHLVRVHLGLERLWDRSSLSSSLALNKHEESK